MVDRFRMKGWTIHFAEADIFEYLRRRASPFVDVVIANLVLHHFSDEEIHELFSLIQTTTSLFVAVEPRRSPMAMAFSRSVRLIGCNAVTRHDAPASVLAGFSANELTPLAGPGSDGCWRKGQRIVQSPVREQQNPEVIQFTQ